MEGIYDEAGKLVISKEEYDEKGIQKIIDRILKVNESIGGDIVLDPTEYLKYRDMKISIIGDSLTEESKNSIQDYMPNAVINSEGNR